MQFTLSIYLQAIKQVLQVSGALLCVFICYPLFNKSSLWSCITAEAYSLAATPSCDPCALIKYIKAIIILHQLTMNGNKIQRANSDGVFHLIAP